MKMGEDMVENPNGTSEEVVEGTATVVEATPVLETPIGELSNAEFCAFPQTDDDDAPVPLIAIRMGDDGQVFYRVWGFPDGGALKTILTAAAHMGANLSDEHDVLLKRLQGVVNVAVGRQ